MLVYKDALKILKRLKSYIFNHNGMKIEISDKRKTEKFTNAWKLNNTFLNNQRVKEEIKREKYHEENKSTTYQNLQDEVKAVLRGTFIGINAYIQETERSQINNPNLCLKEIEKERKTNMKISRRKYQNRNK